MKYSFCKNRSTCTWCRTIYASHFLYLHNQYNQFFTLSPHHWRKKPKAYLDCLEAFLLQRAAERKGGRERSTVDTQRNCMKPLVEKETDGGTQDGLVRHLNHPPPNTPGHTQTTLSHTNTRTDLKAGKPSHRQRLAHRKRPCRICDKK
jgi:hypothetical protein